MPFEFALPFHVGSDGRIATVDDSDVIIRQNVFSLINTHPNERVTVPGYGVDLTHLLFENMDGEDVGTQVNLSVSTAMADHEPGVELTRLDVIEEESGDNYSVVEIEFARRDSADSGEFANTNTAIISANGRVREIVRG